MGLMSQYWSEQYWWDTNCRWNANVGLAQNNTNRTHYLDVYVNGGLYYSNSWGLWQNIPTFWSYRFPARTTFYFFLRTWNYVNQVETDRSSWGTGSFPDPPTPETPTAPGISSNNVSRNVWDVTVSGSNGTNHRVYIWTGSAWSALVTGGGSATYRYSMPVGTRHADFLGDAYNQGPYIAGATNPSGILPLDSQNSPPSTPTGLGATPLRQFTGRTVTVSWTYSDPNGDPQTKYQLAWFKNAGPGGPSSDWTYGPEVSSAATTGTVTVPGPGDYIVAVKTWDWEGYPSGWSVQSPLFQVTKAGVRQGGAWTTGSEWVRTNGLWKPHARQKLAGTRGYWDDQQPAMAWDDVDPSLTWDNYPT